jgi:hypothetical protein
MFDIGPLELLVLLSVFFSGLLAAVYLALALRRNARDPRDPAGPR